MTIFYVHGLGSGRNSRTGRIIERVFSEDNVIRVELPIKPKDAVEYLINMYKEYYPDVMIGTSLGGFYTMLISGCYRILVNPAIDADNIIKEKIGYGTYSYFCDREDGVSEYTIDDEFINELKKLKENFFNYQFDIEHREETYAVFGEKDSVCNCRDIFEKYYRHFQCITADMEHRLSEEDIKIYIVPLVNKIRGL